MISYQPSEDNSDSANKCFAIGGDSNAIVLPDGYYGILAYIRCSYSWSGTGSRVTVLVGTASKSFGPGIWGNTEYATLSLGAVNAASTSNTDTGTITADNDNKNDKNLIGIAVEGWRKATAISVAVKAKRSESLETQWKAKTYNAIMTAYRDRKREAEQSLSEAQVQAGISIQGNNPLYNKEIMERELKKLSIFWMVNAGKSANNGWTNMFDTFNNWCIYEDGNGPVMNTGANVIDNGVWANFMEGTFDWNLMTYEFLPYFYGSPARWREKYRMDDADPLFLQFLQAGVAKVVVPVTPGREREALHFYSEMSVPDTQGELPLNASNELIFNDVIGKEGGDKPIFPFVVKSWKVKLPTSLVILQGKTGVNNTEEGLPNYNNLQNPSKLFNFVPSLLSNEVFDPSTAKPIIQILSPDSNDNANAQ